MSIIARLEYGGDKFELDGGADGTGRYRLGNDFHPPELTEEITYGRALDYGQMEYERNEKNVTWSFTVHIHGARVTELRRAIQDLQAFLDLAGNERQPVFMAWRPFADYRFEPKLGTHGMFSRYEVVNGKVLTGPDYSIAGTHGKYVPVTVRLTTKPGAFRRALAGIAAGGIVEDIYGAPNGKSRGLRIDKALSNNYITNPVFDHPATWNTNWTAGANVYEDQNTDPRYYLFGESSARLVYDGTAGGDTYLTSCATGSSGVAMVISCFVKKVDGAAIESSDFFFVRGSTSIIGMGSGSPLPVGDGWYWCWVATTSNNTSNYGIRLNTAGRYLYMDGFQLEFGTVPTFLCYGDQPGSSWSSTPHASASTRAAGSVKWPRKILLPSYAEGTVRLVWKPDFAAKYVSSGSVHYLYSDNIIDISYDGTNNRFAASDSSNSVDSTSTILGSGTIYVLHFTFDAANGLRLYLNGELVDSNNTYTLPPVASAGTYIYLGSSTGAASHAEGTFYGFGVFNREMSAAEVAADYNELYPLLVDDERVDEIPWLWTKDGGGVVYNQNDSADGNYMLLGGFGGTEVIPEMFLSCDQTWTTIGEIHLGRLAIDQRTFSQYIPGNIAGANYNLLWRDLSGTVDATASGGEVLTQSLSTSSVEFGGTIAFARQNTYLSDKPVSIIGRIKDSGGGGSANLRTTVTYKLGGSVEFEDEFINLPALGTSNYGLVEFGEVRFPSTIRPRPEGGFWDSLYCTATAKRSTGTSNLLVDYIAYLPYPLHIKSGGNSDKGTVIRGKYVRSFGSTWVAGQAEIIMSAPLEVSGYDLVLEGNRLNLLNFVIGTLNDSDTAAITWNLTCNECWLIIRTNGD